ncbi:hypothetical protein DCS_04495 [Drechmeria coniospora]|uniref:Non-homologous end-joining factor 1 n=1 Tax=Drechmeria coniospora TaxID=98403 RepID=A0A151GK51_DRECN|nr:hypothetical protein DCS_04495 [Drechmeria coniospora]KYK57485.1 hypothetical protein DCS_04495 [Drechmeria coniospora]ODA79392.1 hypothetical protein RJ55_04985 [Drechmeria coniospora]
MVENVAWRPLPLPPSPSLPVLLVSAVMAPAAYTVRITDMANVWTETLERRAICMRGWNEGTSIDPSDTPENMAKFLALVRTALDSSRPGHEGSTLRLSPATAADAGQDGLTLRLTCILPGLQPLKWPLHLRKSPPSSLATDLVLPLIQAHYVRKMEVISLIQALADKDAVLTKFSDKLEALGTGLEHIFTHLSGKRKVTRPAAEEKVKGLKAFDEGEWKSRLDSEMDRSLDAGSLLRNVFGESGLQAETLLEIDQSPALDSWWHDAGSLLPGWGRTWEAPAAAQMTSKPPTQAAVADDDDFQVQATPPRFRSGNEKPTGSEARSDDDASTEGEDDEHVIPDSNPPNAQTNNNGHASRHGAISARTASAAPRSPRREENITSKRSVDDSETASEASSDGDAAASMRTALPAPLNPAPADGAKRRGLGVIGGQGRNVDPSDLAKSPEANSAGVDDAPPRASKPGRIGQIGGGPMRMRDDNDRGRALSRTKEPDMIRETSRERADRRREELKRELEKKALPAKKKRRF